jgi:putative hydrolase of the HAD superfamily
VIRLVCFDLDETLLDDNTSYELSVQRVSAGLTSTYADFDFTSLRERYHVLSQSYWQEVAEAVMNGSLSGEEVRLEGWRRALVACGCDRPEIAREALDEYSRHRLATYTLFDDVMEIIATLRPRFKIAVITNGSSFTQREKLERTGLQARVDAVAISAEIGAAKPDPAIFRHIIHKLGIESQSAIHVGDNLDSDVAGAQAAGFRAAIWLNRYGFSRAAEQAMPDLEITSLLEVPDLIGRINDHTTRSPS